MTHNHSFRHRLSNGLHSLLLILLMAGLLGYLAFIVAGPDFALTVFACVVIVFWFNPLVAPSWLLQVYRARLLKRADAPHLYFVVDVLSQRAGLPTPPRLYHLPQPAMNAFAVGHRNDSAIALSDGLLRRLDLYELAGVLGHEISHIRGNDVRVMGLADMSSRVTRVLSLFGILLLLVNLPLILFSDEQIGWLPILALLFAPWIADMAQLALSRVREFQADLGSAELLGDARPLMFALLKMDRMGVNLLEKWVLRSRSQQEPSVLRTHPTTEERIERLRQLEPDTRLTYPPVEQWLPVSDLARTQHAHGTILSKFPENNRFPV